MLEYYNKHKNVLDKIIEVTRGLSNEEKKIWAENNLKSPDKIVYLRHLALFDEYYKSINEVKAREKGAFMKEKYKGLDSLSEAIENGLWEQMTGTVLGKMSKDEALRGLEITHEVKVPSQQKKN